MTHKVPFKSIHRKRQKIINLLQKVDFNEKKKNYELKQF